MCFLYWSSTPSANATFHLSFPTTLQLRPADKKLDFWRSPPMGEITAAAAGNYPSAPGSVSASPSSSCQVGSKHSGSKV